MIRPSPLLVIASDYWQFDDLRRRLHKSATDKSLRFLGEWQQLKGWMGPLRGSNNARLVATGTWWLTKDIGMIEDVARAQGFPWPPGEIGIMPEELA